MLCGGVAAYHGYGVCTVGCVEWSHLTHPKVLLSGTTYLIPRRKLVQKRNSIPQQYRF